MKSKGKILVLDGEWRHSLSVTRSLGKKGLNVVVGSDSRIALSKFSKYCTKKLVYPKPRSYPNEFIKYLVNIIKRERFDLIIPHDDYTVELISKNLAKFEQITKVPYKEYTTVSKALDKAETMKVAIENGIPCPKTYFIEDLDEVMEVSGRLKYPVIIKPRKGTGAIGISKVNSKSELKQIYKKIHAVFPYPIIQEFIPGPDMKLNLCAILNEKSEVKASFTMEYLRLYPHDGGVGTYARSIKNDTVRHYGIKVLKALKWYGIAQVEFKYDFRDRLPKIFEINPRFWGMTEMAVCSGLDLPYILYKMIVCGDNTTYNDYKEEQYLRWFLPGEILHFITNPDRFKLKNDFFKFHRKNLHYCIISKDDPLPISALMINALKAVFEKHTRRLVFRKL
jgi:predicted ATP-grasp superfamily ATP-dependent carboligase